MDIPPIGFGTYLLGDKAYESILHALKLGYRHFDTANLYKTEVALGKAIKDSGVPREEIFITTKVSIHHLRKNKIMTGIKRSFERLDVEYIDLMLLHLPIDCKKNWNILVEAYLGEMKDKIRFIGVSNYSIDDLEEIKDSEVKPYVNQVELSPFFTRDKLITYCNKNEIKIVAHSSLTKGEKLDDETLLEIAYECNLTPAQVLLRWAIEKNYVVIPRADDVNYIKENYETIEKHLTNDILVQLDKLNENYATHPRHIHKEDIS